MKIHRDESMHIIGRNRLAVSILICFFICHSLLHSHRQNRLVLPHYYPYGPEQEREPSRFSVDSLLGTHMGKLGQYG